MELIVGHTYEAKRIKQVGLFFPLYNDRQIVYINRATGMVQYDSPTVALGRKLPFVSIEQFLKWAKRDITDEMTPGNWREWNFLEVK